jgi:V8-like Glu-specific endopeptidase
MMSLKTKYGLSKTPIFIDKFKKRGQNRIGRKEDLLILGKKTKKQRMNRKAMKSYVLTLLMFLIPLFVVITLVAQYSDLPPKDNPFYRLPGSPHLQIPEEKKDWPPIQPPDRFYVAPNEDPTAMEIYDMESGTAIVIPSDDLSQLPVEVGRTVVPPNQGQLHPGVLGESVIGVDGRVRITPTTSYPWRTICKVYITFPNGATGWGSAAIIDNYHILTAGHCVHSQASGGWATSLEVVPAEDSGYMPYNHAWGTHMRSYSGWTVSQMPEHDWAVVTLDRNVGAYTGWMGRTTNPTLSWYTSIFNTAGYPGDRDSGANMYFDSDNGCLADEYRHWYAMDTYGGQSGSPVWYYDGANRYIASIHAYGDFDPPWNCNSGTRLNQDKYDRIITWLGSDTPPTDYADLLDDGQAWSGFSPTTICPGDTFTAWCDVRNIGTASSGGFWVGYYASTNTTISTGDYLIGYDWMASVSPFNYLDSTLTASFPSIPAGTYYVGWIIDVTGLVTEFNEGNNTAYKTGYTLTVRNSPGTPHSPTPPDGAICVSLTPVLTWAASGADSYDVYFGTDPNPPYAGNVASASFAPGTLSPGIQYYWRIEANNTCGTVSGPIWDFTTVILPGAFSNISPSDGATGVPVDANIDWDDSVGATSYDVYFGTTPIPPYVGNVTESMYDPGTLSCGTQYYWKIVARNICGTTAGLQWDFYTVSCSPWSMLTPDNPDDIDAGNIDANAKDELIGDFGGLGLGLWAYYNYTYWSTLTGADAYAIANGDIDNDGISEVVASFSSGTWTYDGTYGWNNISPRISENLACGDLDNNGQDEIIADFGSNGLQSYDNNTSWRTLTPDDATYVTTGDKNNDGMYEVVASFGALGLWTYANATGWMNLTPDYCSVVACGDLDNNGQDDVFGAFPGIGLFCYLNNSSWMYMTNDVPTSMATGDVKNDLKEEFVGGFPLYGMWVYEYGPGWAFLTNDTPEHIACGDFDNDGKAEICGDFGGLGIWVHN